MKKIFLFAGLSLAALGANAQNKLAKLNYGYGEREPYIEAKTMDNH